MVFGGEKEAQTGSQASLLLCLFPGTHANRGWQSDCSSRSLIPWPVTHLGTPPLLLAFLTKAKPSGFETRIRRSRKADPPMLLALPTVDSQTNPGNFTLGYIHIPGILSAATSIWPGQFLPIPCVSATGSSSEWDSPPPLFPEYPSESCTGVGTTEAWLASGRARSPQSERQNG